MICYEPKEKVDSRHRNVLSIAESSCAAQEMTQWRLTGREKVVLNNVYKGGFIFIDGCWETPLFPPTVIECLFNHGTTIACLDPKYSANC